MNNVQFQKTVYLAMKYVNHDEPLAFQTLFEKSKRNERVRNVFAVFALSNDLMFERLVHEASHDQFGKQLLSDLQTALRSSLPVEAKQVAKELHARHFYRTHVGPLTSAVRPSSAAQEMAKALVTVVRKMNLDNQRVTPAQQRHLNSVMGNVQELSLV